MPHADGRVGNLRSRTCQVSDEAPASGEAMQVIERPQLHERIVARRPRSYASLCATTLTALSQRHSSGYSREFIRESVMSWAARKWPELLIGRDACGISFEAHSPCASVQITCAGDGEYAWAFKGTGTDGSGRVWETCVLVLGGEEDDLLTVRTGYAGRAAATPFCAQPKFLCSLIEHLPFEDGGYPIGTEPRRVFSLAAFDNFRDHLLSRRRTLPILAVAIDVASEASAPASPSPAVLARALCGVAHVVSLAGVSVSCLEECLGQGMAVRAGDARLFMPGLAPDDEPDKHPAFANLDVPAHSEASYVEAAAQRATHSWSTSIARRADFEALWAKSGGA